MLYHGGCGQFRYIPWSGLTGGGGCGLRITTRNLRPREASENVIVWRFVILCLIIEILNYGVITTGAAREVRYISLGAIFCNRALLD